MPVLSARIPARDIPRLNIELLQFGLSSNAELIDLDGPDAYVDIVGPLGKSGEAVTRAGGEILDFVDKVRR